MLNKTPIFFSKKKLFKSSIIYPRFKDINKKTPTIDITVSSLKKEHVFKALSAEDRIELYVMGLESDLKYVIDHVDLGDVKAFQIDNSIRISTSPLKDEDYVGYLSTFTYRGIVDAKLETLSRSVVLFGGLLFGYWVFHD